MIKISKNLLLNPARIWVSGIKWNFENIAKIAGFFDCKWVVVTIDSLKKGVVSLKEATPFWNKKSIQAMKT